MQTQLPKIDLTPTKISTPDNPGRLTIFQQLPFHSSMMLHEATGYYKNDNFSPQCIRFKLTFKNKFTSTPQPTHTCRHRKVRGYCYTYLHFAQFPSHRSLSHFRPWGCSPGPLFPLPTSHWRMRHVRWLMELRPATPAPSTQVAPVRTAFSHRATKNVGSQAAGMTETVNSRAVPVTKTIKQPAEQASIRAPMTSV